MLEHSDCDQSRSKCGGKPQVVRYEVTGTEVSSDCGDEHNRDQHGYFKREIVYAASHGRRGNVARAKCRFMMPTGPDSVG